MFNKMVEIIGDSRFSSDDLKIVGYHLFKKLAAGTIYNPNRKFKGPVTLIKATDNFIPLEKDYGLSNVRYLSGRFFSKICLCSIFTNFLFFFFFLINIEHFQKKLCKPFPVD